MGRKASALVRTDWRLTGWLCRALFVGLAPHPLVITEQSVSGTVRASVRDGNGQRDARGQFDDVGKEVSYIGGEEILTQLTIA